jgi:MoaA/NifB/PqqE/SkfB family radical SAM enzyme
MMEVLEQKKRSYGKKVGISMDGFDYGVLREEAQKSIAEQLKIIETLEEGLEKIDVPELISSAEEEEEEERPKKQTKRIIKTNK